MAKTYCINKKVFDEKVKKIYREFRKGLKGDYNILPLSRFVVKVRKMSRRLGTAYCNDRFYSQDTIKKIIINFCLLESFEEFRKTLIHEFGHFAVGRQPDGWHGRKFRMLMLRFNFVTLASGHTITKEEEKEKEDWVRNYEQQKREFEEKVVNRR